MGKELSQRALAELEHKTKKENHQRIIDIYGPANDDGLSDIILFFKQFEHNGKISKLYKYLAILNNGLWFVTGQPNRFDWFELIGFIEEENVLAEDGDATECMFFNQGEWVPLYEIVVA